MFGNINDDNVVEQTFENENNRASESSVVDTPATSTDKLEQNRDYLNPALFSDVRTISIEELNSDTALNNSKNKVCKLTKTTNNKISNRFLKFFHSTFSCANNKHV